jgi:hypothetical protein
MNSAYEKKADKIAEGADVHTTQKEVSQPVDTDEDSQKLEPSTVSLYAEYKTFIRAIAYQERITQREVIERAINDFYSSGQKLQEVAQKFEEHH